MTLTVGMVCSANVCRSPMAAALLAERARHHGVDLQVRSAGMIGGGRRVDPAVLRAMDRRGIDLDAHRSVALAEIDLHGLDLLLTMERDHLREVVVADPDLFRRTFTLKEYVRRSEGAGGRGPGEPWDGWLDRLGTGRDRAELLGDDRADDVLYPAPPTLRAVEATARDLRRLADELLTRSFHPTAIERPPAAPFNT
jgi:protein-tyrosine phosphatase